MMWRRGKIISLGKTWRGAREAEVELEDGSRARALAYPDLVGEPAQVGGIAFEIPCRVEEHGSAHPGGD
ncbi:hypothetical protein R6G99_10560, partial [Actinotignum timonense]|nr:hypothetical protein [Actinotignum timonense]